MGERVPQHVQNLVIRDYCERNQLQYLLSGTEYAMSGSHLILQQLLDDLDNIDGICVYSIFQLPEDAKIRSKMLKKMLYEKKAFYFAVEGLRMSSDLECERIEVMWKIRRMLPQCLMNSP